ncbi:MAG: tetratricopeptide repeat protein [Verrucomicrobiota bacterium]
MMNFGIIRSLVAVSLIGVFSVGAQNSSDLEVLLEEGVFLEEGKGDFKKAYELYSKVVDADLENQAVAAEAMFRQAVCLMEMGRRPEALTVLNTLVKNYPEQSEWAERALGILPRAFKPTLIPWSDGERVHMVWKLATGNVLGFSANTVREFEWEGRRLWRNEFQALVNGQDIRSASEVDWETFEPVYGHFFQETTGAINWWYKGETIEIEYARSGSKRSIPVIEGVKDNEQVLLTMRQFPLEEGFSVTMDLFVGMSGVTTAVDATIEKFETIETPMGPMECYVVGFSQMMGNSQKWWITTDERRLLAKMEMGSIIASIYKIDTAEQGRKNLYEQEAYGYSFRLDDAFVVLQDPNEKDPGEIRFFAIEQEARGRIEVFSQPESNMMGTDSGDTEESATVRVDRVKSQRTGFAYIGEEWERGEKDGEPWMRSTFTYDHGGPELFDCMTFFKAKGRFHIMRVRGGREHYDYLMGVYDEMFQSLDTGLEN